MNTHYFTITDEEGRTAGVIKATTSRDLESLIMNCTIEHHCVDDAALSTSLNIDDFKGQDKTITVKCFIGDDPEIFYDMRIESVVLYEI
ncbi:hypothetical protein [Thalassobellus suaedae]|uniref:Uncharacterized protein n=1 Tax=Thalassobellus suaedae TaxID=3074124 RepID=A0ABY9XVV2_9FLAO|nr:hypothetical protein RHP51_05115 [Flavobacteriaceae bacterium HL-DH14]